MQVDSTYLELTDQEKRFVQKMVYHEYMEVLTVIYHNNPDSEVTIEAMVAYDLQEAKINEDYEKCQLYTDVLENELHFNINDIK